jgi:hypothetical protein
MKNIGEKLTFHQLINDKDYKIQVPIIQRDYAQGRDSADEVRDVFLSEIYSALSEGKKLHLDFIYGSIENNDNFLLLDGQQRITTLFLLHWYLAVKDDKFDDFAKAALKGTKSKFTYETRISSREFCQALLINEINLPLGLSLSAHIKDHHWFASSWEKDPTIKSMLVMLDTINEKFSRTEGFYEKLITDSTAIDFQFIELEHFGLTDNLYIKMNARGKELTSFENFKAEFEEYLDELDLKNGTSLKTKFANSIDQEWTDTFWPYKNKETNIFDTEILNFIIAVLTNYYVLDHDHKNHLSKIQNLISPKRALSFKNLKEIGALKKEYIEKLIKILDAISGTKDKIAAYINKDILDEERIFLSAVSGDITYPERVILFATYEYLIYNGKPDGIEEWVRVVRNLTENTRIEDMSQYQGALKGTKDLLKCSTSIIAHFATLKEDVNGFYGLQVEEEKLKAKLISKSVDWSAFIREIENHKYFLGQIEFILDFAGVSEFYSENKNVDWDTEKDKQFLDNFKKYSKIADSIFDRNGLKEFPEFAFERALLSIGDYLLYSRQNFSFLVNSKGEREISWKRLLRGDGESERREYIKDLFDQIGLDNIHKSLTKIIDKSTITDWRKYFIHHHDLIGACGSLKFARFSDWHETLIKRRISLMSKTQMNGYHKEYYTYALTLQLEKEYDAEVAYHEANAPDLIPKIAYINDFKIEITWIAEEVDEDQDVYELDEEAGKYHIKFKKDRFTCEGHDEIIKYLIKKGIVKK